jgi:co-chaperonin GroES (HSP10)
MTKKESKKDLIMAEIDSYEFDDAHEKPKRSSASRRIRKVHPLGYRVLVRIQRDSNVTDTGLYLPEGAKLSMAESVLAEVIEVASTLEEDSDEETNVSGIPMGARVLIAKNAGVRIPWDDELRLVDTKDVLALVDEISLI